MLEEEIASQVARTQNRRRNELSSKFLGLLTPRQANRTPKGINGISKGISTDPQLRPVLEKPSFFKYSTQDAYLLDYSLFCYLINRMRHAPRGILDTVKGGIRTPWLIR